MLFTLAFGIFQNLSVSNQLICDLVFIDISLFRLPQRLEIIYIQPSFNISIEHNEFQ